MKQKYFGPSESTLVRACLCLTPPPPLPLHVLLLIIIIIKNFNRRSSHGHHGSKRRELAQHAHSRGSRVRHHAPTFGHMLKIPYPSVAKRRPHSRWYGNTSTLRTEGGKPG